MGAVESSLESGVEKFADSVSTKNKNGSTWHGQDNMSTEISPYGPGNAIDYAKIKVRYFCIELILCE